MFTNLFEYQNDYHSHKKVCCICNRPFLVKFYYSIFFPKSDLFVYDIVFNEDLY